MIAAVRLWGRVVGAVSQEENSDSAAFQYNDAFAHSGIELSPLVMPLSSRVYTFPELPLQTFHGLPGLLADALPDRFGNTLIDAWLATQGRSPENFRAVERLCYTGARGMGALEFMPLLGPRPRKTSKIKVDELVRLAGEVLLHRQTLQGYFHVPGREKTLRDILRVGTSAGGARAKAVIAWNPVTHEVRSGQVEAEAGFEYWLLKFDGVAGNSDKETADPAGYGAVEYAYYLMARDAGVTISECRLLEENERRHFMTRRFDRLPGGAKLHMQSLCALAHYDFNQAGAYGYEQALTVVRRLGLPVAAVEELFRRMIFNIIARNQDDHVKNIAFLMNRAGQWSLAPAFDLTYSYNPAGLWTATHQMTVNGKRNRFTMADLTACAKAAFIQRGRVKTIFEEVREAVARWPEHAMRAKVTEPWQNEIQKNHRLSLPVK